MGAGRVGYHLRAGAEDGIVCRFTVGQDLVGTSVAEGERVSPQRARVVRAAACRASPVRLLVVARGHV